MARHAAERGVCTWVWRAEGSLGLAEVHGLETPRSQGSPPGQGKTPAYPQGTRGRGPAGGRWALRVARVLPPQRSLRGFSSRIRSIRVRLIQTPPWRRHSRMAALGLPPGGPQLVASLPAGWLVRGCAWWRRPRPWDKCDAGEPRPAEASRSAYLHRRLHPPARCLCPKETDGHALA